MRTRARRVAVVVFDEVELLDLALPLEILSSAGRRWNFRPYKVDVVAPEAGLVLTRAQLKIEATEMLAAAEPADIVLVPGGYGARRLAADAAFTSALAQLANAAECIGAVGTGVLPLLEAGLLPAGEIAVTPELAHTLAGAVAPERLNASTNSVVKSGRVLTVARSAGATDLSLAIVRDTLGPKLASTVASELGFPTNTTPIKIQY